MFRIGLQRILGLPWTQTLTIVSTINDFFHTLSIVLVIHWWVNLFTIVTFFKKAHNLLSFENVKNLKYVCFTCKVRCGLALPPVSEFIIQRTDCGVGTRSIIRADCEVPYFYEIHFK